jgi:hypothetical protein
MTLLTSMLRIKGHRKAASPITLDRMPNPRACRIWKRNQLDVSGRGVISSINAVGQKR